MTDSGFTIEAYTKPPNGHGWVEYYFPDTPFTHPPQSWVMEGGKWRWDGCFPFQMPAARPR